MAIDSQLHLLPFYHLNYIIKDLEDRNLLQEKSLKLEKIMNEKMSKRRKKK